MTAEMERGRSPIRLFRFDQIDAGPGEKPGVPAFPLPHLS